MLTVIDEYIQQKLPSFFKKYDIPEEVIELVSKDIQNRIYSMLFYWNDPETRRVLLTTGIEEASFYEPKVKIELRCFVVATIRNSLFENLVSTKEAAKSLGLKRPPIPETDVKLFTQEAIEHFKEANFEELYERIRVEDFINI